MDKATYDEVIQVTCTPAQKTMMEKIAEKRHTRYSRKYKKNLVNLAAACREAFSEYITRHRQEVE